jgi:bifunctional non-homologous end joining protein LigD
MAAKRTSKQKSKDLVDAQLERYRSMRDFAATSEPSGAAKSQKAGAAKSPKAQAKQPAAGLPFVIQKHAATRLHYDFRLGWKGVLKSWAVAKGPSYLTHDKRLAVQVEDHPIEYGGFEGIIPQGQYGGGTVMLWDTGTWEPQSGHTDVDAGLRDGSLKFTMHGTKMKGNWALIRMGGKAANEKKPNWLLIKEHDSFERTEGDPAITDEKPDSVLTGRTMDEIASNQDHVWNSKASARQVAHPVLKKPQTAAEPKRKAKPALRLELNTYPKEELPKFIAPQLASQANAAPAQSGWIHELKLDGYRIEARKDGTKVQLLTRTGLDWTHRMKTIAAAIVELPAQTALLDGEVVVLRDNGSTSFADLQASFKEEANHPLTYFAFDLLHLNGRNLRGLELVERKNLLASLLDGVAFQDDAVRFSDHIETSGDVVFQKACALHAEGIVSKRSSAAYVSGRTSAWIKVKCIYEQEFVIGGFTLPSNGIHGVGALLLGYYGDQGKLIYAGRSGTGFTQKTHRSLRNQLEKLRQKDAPFADMAAAERRKAIWVKPELVAQIGFASWTADNLVRQATFKGIREDKPAKEVRREEPVREDAGLPAQAKHGTRSKVAAKAVSPASKKRAVKSSSDSDQQHAAIRLTHPDKVLDTESKLTKQQLADYYWTIAEHMLPQIANRPLSLVRCPEGSTNPCFFQKHTNAMLPPGIETIEVPDKKTGKLEPYITLSTRESLAGLAQMSVLEVHAWGSQNNNLEHPDRIVIDLDPDESIPWKTLAASAAETRDLFKKLGLKSFLKSTGGKGLHVVVPIEPEHDWPTVKQFAHAVALKLEGLQPALYLTKMSKAARKGRIFVDYLRNERGATAIAPFSPRARAGANVSMPLSWSELEEPEHPRFRVVEFDRWKHRLAKDPWKALPGTAQRIDPDKAARVLELA